MTALAAAFRRYLNRTDALLLGAAVLGLVCYLVAMPSQHPDAAASYALGAAGAQQTAEAYLVQHGYAVDALETRVQFRRHVDLLNALQATVGRPEARRRLADRADLLPAYYWRVQYRPARDDPDADPPFYVNLTQTGKVWSMQRAVRNEETGPPVVPVNTPPSRRQSDRIDRNALRHIFALPAPAVEGAAPGLDLTAFPDSLLTTRLRFEPANPRWGRLADLGTLVPDTTALRAHLLPNVDRAPGFGPEVAVALARHHLRHTAWAAETFAPDSAWTVPSRNDRVARVRLRRTEPLHGQAVQADVTVFAAGALYELDVTFNPAPAPRSTWSTVAGILKVTAFVILILVLVIAFFKRVSARLIDGKAAMVDGLVLGLMTVLMFGLFKDLDFGPDFPLQSVWVQRALLLLFAVVAGAAVALFTMMVSGVTDSLTRASWPEKLRTASFVRFGSFRNVYVGAALLRGVMVAFVLLGLLAALLTLLPSATLHFGEDENARFLDVVSYQPLTMQAASVSLTTYFVLVFVVLGAGVFVFTLWKRLVPFLVVVVLGMMLTQGASIDLDPVGYSWLLSGLWGLVLGLTFWRFDFLTTFTALFLALLTWLLSQGWLVTASPIWMDAALAALLTVGVLGLGVLGLISGRTRRDVVDYVPDYINELTQQERLKRELEIARQVQASFLPHRMPEIDGLDIAGMCLAALEVGGDYYDFVSVGPGRLAVVVGDVSGKGTQAAFYMTLTKGFVQTLSRENLSPAEVMRRLNTLFCANAPRGTFISVIYGVIDVPTRTFTFARAGHNPIILKRSPSQDTDLIQPAGLAIGLVTGPTFDDTIEEVTLELRLGDVLVFYTDGFSEAMNRAKDLYGDDRLARKVGDVGQRSANEILRAVTEDVHHFVEAAGRHDDMTMVVVKLVRATNHRAAPAAAERRAVKA